MMDSNILIFFKDNWELTLGFAAAIGTVIGYFLTRRNELTWKRTEFICTQAHYLNNDPVLVETVQILEERHPTLKVNDIFDSKSTLDEEKRNDCKQRFDKLLNFLWQLCYAYLEVKTLSRKEVEGFGWYFHRISRFPALVDYCENNGFEDINVVTRKLRLGIEE
ncbi:MAG: hypothetical protein ABIA75_02365 [Candidatus Neomarinimicrobiota bacterium]